jgi:hypothetical protein
MTSYGTKSAIIKRNEMGIGKLCPDPMNIMADHYINYHNISKDELEL